MLLGVEKVIVTGLPPLPVSSTPVNCTTTCGAPSAGGASATDNRMTGITGAVLEFPPPPPHATRPSAAAMSHGGSPRSLTCRHIRTSPTQCTNHQLQPSADSMALSLSQ